MTSEDKPSKKTRGKESGSKAESEEKTKKTRTKAKAGSVTVTEVAEVTEPLEVVETVEMERTATPEEEISAEEIEPELRELKPREGMKIVVGLPRLTRFEKARIVGARALQLSLGAPPLVPTKQNFPDSIRFAEFELEQKALPISLRRLLPNGQYQDIPMAWLMESAN